MHFCLCFAKSTIGSSRQVVTMKAMLKAHSNFPQATIANSYLSPIANVPSQDDSIQHQNLPKPLKHRPNTYQDPKDCTQAPKHDHRNQAQRNMAEESSSSCNRVPDFPLHNLLCAIPLPGSHQSELGINLRTKCPTSHHLPSHRKDIGERWSGADVEG